MNKIVCAECGKDAFRYGNAKFCLKCMEWGKRRPLATAAHRMVAAAIQEGILPKQDTLECVDCGDRARDYDHRDYTKPLDVEPVCRSCNCYRGPGFPYLEEPV